MANSRDKTKRKYEYNRPSTRATERASAFGGTLYRIPKNMEKFQPQIDQKYKVDFLGYLVQKGKKEPGGNPFAKKGTLHYERTFWAHYGVGVANKPYVCPAMTFGKRCPICEDRTNLMRDRHHDKEMAKSLKPKERQLFYLYDRTDAKEEAKGVKLWEYSPFNFTELLEEEYIQKADPEDREQREQFYSYEDGSTLSLTFAEKTTGTNKYGAVSIIEFKARKKPLNDSIIDDLEPLDDLLIEVPYDKLKALHLGEEVDEEDDDKDDDDKTPPKAKKPDPDDDDDDTPAKPPTGKNTPPTKPDEDEDDDDDTPAPVKPPKGDKAKKKPGDDDTPPAKKKPADDTNFAVGDKVIYEDEECEIIKVSGDGTSLTVKDGDGSIHKAVDPIEVRLAPPKKAKKKPDPDDDD